MRNRLFKAIFILVAVMICFSIKIQAETVIFDPSQNGEYYDNGVRYGRGIQLKCDEAGDNKGNIYTTCEYFYYPGHYGEEHFPVFESKDMGKSFHHVSDIYDTAFNQKRWKKSNDGTYYEVPLGTNGATTYYNNWWGMVFQPTLYELPEKLGSLEKGTVLCVGTTHDSKGHSAIVIYYSADGLRSWEYLSTVTMGGWLSMGQGTAIWEGYLIYENGELYCFYTSEVGLKEGGQRLLLRKTADGKNWGEEIRVCDFQEENSSFRPGMAVITKMANGKFFLIYEGVNMGNGYMPVYYKISDNIGEWKYKEHGTELPYPFHSGSPYCTTLKNGAVVVGTHGTDKIGVNTNSAKTNEWQIWDTDVENAYSRALFPLLDGRLLITSGGAHGATSVRKLTCSVENIDIDTLVKPKTITGTNPWNDNHSNGVGNVSDSDAETFFDGLKNGYVILDFGEVKKISGIGYTPRYDYSFRMKGGIFYGSNDSVKWTKLYTIEEAPSNRIEGYVNLGRCDYRYIKYTSNGSEACNIAEIKVYAYEEDEPKVTVGDAVNIGMLDDPINVVFAKYSNDVLQKAYMEQVDADREMEIPKGFEKSSLMLFKGDKELQPVSKVYDIDNYLVYTASNGQNEDAFYAIESNSFKAVYSFEFTDKGSKDAGVIIGSRDSGLEKSSTNYFAKGSIVIVFSDGDIYYRDAEAKKLCAHYEVGESVAVSINADVEENKYDLYINDICVAERLNFRVGADVLDTLVLVENRGGKVFDVTNFRMWNYKSSVGQNEDAFYDIGSNNQKVKYSFELVDNGSNDSGIIIGNNDKLNRHSTNYFASGSIVITFGNGQMYYIDETGKQFAGEYQAGESVEIFIEADIKKNVYDLYINNSLVKENISFRLKTDALDTLALVENGGGEAFDIYNFNFRRIEE